MCQKWFVRFRAGDFSLDREPQSGRPGEADSGQIEINWEQSTFYHVGDSWHAQTIQINIVIGENKKKMCLLVQPNLSAPKVHLQ